MSRPAYSILAAVALTAGAASAQEEKVVNVYNWSDYIDESILEEFTKELQQKHTRCSKRSRH